MEFFVYSRFALEAVQPHEVSHVIISITSAPGDVARFRTNEHCRDVLRLAFPDADDPSDEYPEAILFSAAHASQIWEFVLRHRDAVERIVVHCDAGMSRSPAVAAAIARGLGEDDAQFFSGRYHPNKRVYRLLLDAAPPRATARLVE